MQFPVEMKAFLGGVRTDRPLGCGYNARIRKSTMVANNWLGEVMQLVEYKHFMWNHWDFDEKPTSSFERLFSFGTNYYSVRVAAKGADSSISFSKLQNSNRFNNLRSLRSVDPRPM